jgi:hypothetical protein
MISDLNHFRLAVSRVKSSPDSNTFEQTFIRARNDVTEFIDRESGISGLFMTRWLSLIVLNCGCLQSRGLVPFLQFDKHSNGKKRGVGSLGAGVADACIAWHAIIFCNHLATFYQGSINQRIACYLLSPYCKVSQSEEAIGIISQPPFGIISQPP